MSISSALNAAQSGLATSQALSRVSAENVSNSMTPGYVKREGILVSRGPDGGGGVQVKEIRRDVDAAITRVARNELGKMTRHQAVFEGLQGYSAYLGQPSDEASPAARFSEFNTSLTTLVNLPSSNGAQLGAVVAAEELSASIVGASNFLAQVKSEVDMEVRYEVSDLNSYLYELASLNPLTTKIEPGSFERAEFEDRIDGLLDEVSKIADIRVSTTSDGWVNVYTNSGTALLEGEKVHDVRFEAALGELFAGDQEITPGKDGLYGIETGSLRGFLELKNEILPRFQLQLDEFARVLIQGFEAIDLTLNSGQVGLFTDNGQRFDSTRLDGLAGRLQVNDAVTAINGNEVWRIRDGFGGEEESNASSTSYIQAALDFFETSVEFNNDAALGSSVKVVNLASEIVAIQQSERANSEIKFERAKSASEVINSTRRNVEGVNIDDEIQRLTLIEQSFAANSSLLKTLNEMFETLLNALR